MLSPDAVYVTAEKLKGITQGFQGFLRLSPDFVIELLSRSDSLAEAKNKMTLWMENGVTLGWLVSPYTKTVYLYPPDKRDMGFTGKSCMGRTQLKASI